MAGIILVINPLKQDLCSCSKNAFRAETHFFTGISILSDNEMESRRIFFIWDGIGLKYRSVMN
jgi:hypothetical protein